MTILCKNCHTLESIHDTATMGLIYFMLDNMIDIENKNACLIIIGENGQKTSFYRDEWAELTLPEKENFDIWLQWAYYERKR